MKNKRIKASFTIEAAFIVPLVMVVIVGIIFISFLVHDMVTMDAQNTYTLIENANEYNDNIDLVESDLSKELNRKLIITKNISVDSKKRSDGIIVKSCGAFSLPSLTLTELFGTKKINESSEIMITNLDGRGSLLKNKAIVEGIKQIGEAKS